ncbi:MAG TPA: putative toxin-antitoxin system toxin component, PIN family [Pirellulales bacterium]|nr:putative toxin-antitoxin system toxin component, PIN family [Pirellulales bacterium]
MTDRAVFDCMIYLQAVANEDGPAFACFRCVDQGLATLCVSAEVLAEVRDVLSRAPLRARFPRLTAERVEAFLENVEAKAVLIAEIPCDFSYPRDPEDEPYLNLAVAAGAKHLVSRDADLLDLMDDLDFRGRFPGLTILDPVAFLRRLPRGSQAKRGSEHA